LALFYLFIYLFLKPHSLLLGKVITKIIR